MHDDRRALTLGGLSGLAIGSLIAAASAMSGAGALLAGQLEIGGTARLVVHLAASAAAGVGVGWLCRSFATRTAASLGTGVSMGVAVVLARIDARHSPWWMARQRRQQERISRRLELVRSSAPALWATSALTTVLLLLVLAG